MPSLAVVGAQALDAQRHVRQSACSVDARANAKAKVLAAGQGGVATGRFKEGAQAHRQMAFANALQALRDQAAVVGIQTHHIGHRAQRHQRQQRVQLGAGARIVEPLTLAQLGAQGQQDIKHHPHAGQVLAGKVAAGLVGVHDHIGLGQMGRRQVVVGDEHLHAQGFRGGYAFHAGDAVVHGDQHLCAGGMHTLGNAGGQAIAIDQPVGHHITHMPRAQGAQAAQAHGTGSGAIAVVVGHDAQVQVLGQSLGQQLRGRLRTFQGLRGQEVLQARVQLFGSAHAACGVQLCQQGMNAGLFQGPDAARGRVALNQLHDNTDES